MNHSSLSLNQSYTIAKLSESLSHTYDLKSPYRNSAKLYNHHQPTTQKINYRKNQTQNKGLKFKHFDQSDRMQTILTHSKYQPKHIVKSPAPTLTSRRPSSSTRSSLKLPTHRFPKRRSGHWNWSKKWIKARGSRSETRWKRRTVRWRWSVRSSIC